MLSRYFAVTLSAIAKSSHDMGPWKSFCYKNLNLGSQIARAVAQNIPEQLDEE